MSINKPARTTQDVFKHHFIEMIWQDLSALSVKAAFFWRGSDQEVTLNTTTERDPASELIQPIFLMTEDFKISDFEGQMLPFDLANNTAQEFHQVNRNQLRLPSQISAMVGSESPVCSVFRSNNPEQCNVVLFHPRLSDKSYAEILMMVKHASETVAHFMYREDNAEYAENYRTIFDILPEALVYIPNSMAKGFVNKMAADLLGVFPGETPINQIATAMAELRNRTENREKLAKRDILGITDGKVDIDEVWELPNSVYHVRSVALASSQQGSVWQLRDITTLHKREQQLVASEKLRLMGMISGGIAHEFNNIFQTIMAVADNLEVNGKDIEIQKAAETLFSLSTKASTITHSLSLFAKNAYLRPKKIKPESSIQDIYRRLRHLVPQHINFRLQVFSSEEEKYLFIDIAQLELCLTRLVQNAVESFEARSFQGINKTIAISLIDHDQECEIGVQDNGSGMTEETRAYATEPFFTTREDRLALGLGLSEVDGFVRQSGGRLVIESNEGKGTSVSLMFPLSARSCE